ncbi:Dihydroorotase, multifunctional complex type protein [Candidatus Glomeribacter gigasporarum BEG34]|uniref:Dihydroorotase, multifunctional complex type protein n=1 Tax=Candidatus Glomeribacter gigasporarum BEG34 TaxID=1070319 RepID=G2J8J2_9BURK|nr:dihydroorotase [Candidatus Glomeribacter gigasporarum]CCD29089.1 Dihydroorotase, multifunctional complex type protein [Candidatus Glomeribacter gigasporarum BEG34]
MNLHLFGGCLIDPATGTDTQADLFISEGQIAGIGAPPPDFHAHSKLQTLDARGLVVIPGLVDLCARFGAAGRARFSSVESELAAALAGGVTHLVCPPDTDPPLDDPARVEMLRTRAGAFWRMHIYLLGALTSQLNGHTLANLSELADAGCVGFSNADAPLADTQVLWRALQYASTFDLAIWLRPQDAALSRHGVAASGEYASRLGLPDVPEIAETIALDTIFELMRATGARVHLSHLSSAAGLERVRSAKREGLPLSCDVTLNHLHFVDTDIGAFNPLLRLDPPLRGARDRASIRAALADGTIDAICSAHTPVHDDAKKQPFGEAAPGAVGLELLLSMTVKWAEEEHIPLVQALAKVTCAPADVLGLKIGRIEIGQAADLTLFDPHARWRVTPEALKGQSRNTPFLGYEASARVRSVIISGRIVFKSEG